MAREVLNEHGMVAALTPIDVPREIDRYFLSGPPGLVINDELAAYGRVPSSEEIVDWIVSAHDRVP
jgi:hypothetical protein